MKKIIVKLLACFIPNKSKRKAFKNRYIAKNTSSQYNIVAVGDMYLSDTIKALCIKEDIVSKKNSVKILVFGSSHAQMSFVDGKDSLNFGNGSLDLYYQWKLYEKFHSFFPNLQNIVIFYDVFSGGNDMQKGPFYKRTALYKLIFDIPYKNKKYAVEQGVIDFEKELELKYCPIAKNLLESIDHSYPIICSPSADFTQEQLQTFAKGQIKLNKKDNGMHKYLNNILNLAEKLHHNVLIVVAPYQSNFRQMFPEKSILFKNLNSIKKERSFKILNLWDDLDFVVDDFRNPDHLNRKGAVKLTKKIRDVLK